MTREELIKQLEARTEKDIYIECPECGVWLNVTGIMFKLDPEVSDNPNTILLQEKHKCTP